MKLATKTFTVLTLMLTGFIIGCGGGGGSSANSNPSDGQSGTESAFFSEVDENALLSNPPETKIRTVSNDAVIDTTPVKGPKVETAKGDVVTEAADGSTITLSLDINASRIGQPLFVDGVFKGMIGAVKTSGSNTVVTLEDAQRLGDVYDKLDLLFRNDEIKASVQRTLDSGKIKGRYDAANAEPLRISVLEKPVTNARGLTDDELILRIDIPEGYTVPIEPRGIDCSFLNAECELTTEGNLSNKIPLTAKSSGSGITFSTKGSYIEIGLGMYLRAHYDHNYIGLDQLDFDLAQSAYFKANITASVSGELKKEWETTLKLLDDFDVEILHPYSMEAKTGMIVTPDIIIGADGSLKGTFTIGTYVERGGEVRFGFNSADLSHTFKQSVTYTPKDVSKDSLGVAIEASANAYAIPGIKTLPYIRFFRIGPSIALVIMRSGIKLNTNVNGKIAADFVVENEQTTTNTTVEASMTASLKGIIQDKWYVRISPFTPNELERCYDLGKFFAAVDKNEKKKKKVLKESRTYKCLLFYKSAKYKEILSTKEYKILEWKGSILNAPTISVEDDITDFDKKKIEFDLNIDNKIKPKVYYYYTTDGSDIPIAGIEKHKPVWHAGDLPVSVDKNSKIKVRAVLYNKDVSTSVWAWGSSVSPQSEKLITEINEPMVTPSNKAFEETLTITITQDQGFDILYQKNGGASVKYSGPIDLDEDTTLVVYARTEIDGQKFYSQKRTYKYDKCESDEKLEGGVCVQDESSSSSSSSSQSSLNSCPLQYDPALDNHPESDTFLSLNADDFPNRTECYYYSSGQLRAEAPYANGKRNGIDKGYYRSGQIAAETPYTDGLENGISKIYWENGVLEAEIPFSNGMQNGIVKHYYETGGIERISDQFIDGELIGTEKQFKEDGEMYQCLIFDGSTKHPSCMP